MSAGKLVKGIVKRLLNSGNNHHHHHTNKTKHHYHHHTKDSFFLCEHFTDEDEDNDDDDTESCWRRHRRSKKSPKHRKSLALPDIVPREHDAPKNHHCHQCHRLYQPHHHHHHHGEEMGREGDGGKGGWPPVPICVCEDCYLAIINICQDRCACCSPSPRRPVEGETTKKEERVPQRPITEHPSMARYNKDLPPSIAISRDSEQPYRVCLKSLFPPGILGPTVAPPNRTICHVTAAS